MKITSPINKINLIKNMSAALVILMTIGFMVAPLASPSKLELKKWSEFTTSSKIKLDHSIWDKILKKHITTRSQVTYFSYNKMSSDDKKALTQYLSKMSTINPTSLNKNEAKAYWINIYNAVTVEIVLKNYPIKSIRDIKSGFFSSGPWDTEAFTVEGQSLTLNNIEHNILRPLFNDNRIHYAINCASYSCPNLSNTAYTHSNIESQLNNGAKIYINHSRGIKFIDSDEIEISSIWKWFKEDFGTSEINIIKHLQRYAEPELKAKLISFDGSVNYNYNWNLNE